VEDPYVCDDVGIPKGQCINCGYKYYEHEDVVPGSIYQHYKGGTYLVLHIATHTETREKLVVYRAAGNAAGIWARPYSMFIGDVYGQTLPTKRFLRIK